MAAQAVLYTGHDALRNNMRLPFECLTAHTHALKVVLLKSTAAAMKQRRWRAGWWCYSMRVSGSINKCVHYIGGVPPFPPRLPLISFARVIRYVSRDVAQGRARVPKWRFPVSATPLSQALQRTRPGLPRGSRGAGRHALGHYVTATAGVPFDWWLLSFDVVFKFPTISGKFK